MAHLKLGNLGVIVRRGILHFKWLRSSPKAKYTHKEAAVRLRENLMNNWSRYPVGITATSNTWRLRDEEERRREYNNLTARQRYLLERLRTSHGRLMPKGNYGEEFALRTLGTTREQVLQELLTVNPYGTSFILPGAANLCFKHAQNQDGLLDNPDLDDTSMIDI